MPVKPLLLVLASALVHAAWNAILKRCREPEAAVLAGSLVSASFAVVAGVVLGFDLGRGAAAGWCVAAGVLEALYFRTLARALAEGALGTVYTVSRGGALLVVWPVSVLLLGEHLTVLRASGTALVLGGLAASGLLSSAASEPGTRRGNGVALAALTGVFIGGYNLAYKVALAGGVSPATANAISLGLAGLLNLTTMGASRRSRATAALREAPVAIGIAGFLGATGFLLFLAALEGAFAGVILTLRNASIPFATAFGLLLGERPSKSSLAGTAAVTAGAVLLAM